ncbi:MAG: Calcium-transporting ATPase 1 [candidate division WS6 bacterium OLB21]|uniref:Calcium-transporting ATPase 1 n=1 Tax=candidate division WS6 bacterium OLB21 TaxID=1617427 RepID=A0A136KJ97_9BACT|nr:MAG: Calcium-transporting ATPase 1 [candidate division WS6 bacterium OLB21]
MHAGLKVPGDAIIIEESELLVDESILTGESHPVEKSVGDTQLRQEEIKGIHKVFMGSTVVEGYGYAKVYATSDKTQFGKIAESLEDKFDPPTPIRLELQRLSKLVILIVIFITGFVGILGILRNMPLDDVILTSVSLAGGDYSRISPYSPYSYSCPRHE